MRLRTILLSSACAIALPALASAADLPLRSAPPAFAPPPPVFTWTGFYLGVNAGYDFDHSSRYRQFNGSTAVPQIGTAVPAVVDPSDSGFTGGGQIGYNYQFGGYGSSGLAAASFVIGLEADAAYTDIDKTVTNTGAVPGGAAILATTNTFRSQLDYLGTVRGRVGVAFDRVLIYGTGGLAYGQVDNDIRFSVPGSLLTQYTGSRSSMETGYTVGGGIEYAIPTDSFLSSLNFFHSSAVTIKAEYLYYNLGTSSVADVAVAGNGGAGSYLSRVRTDGSLVRAGLNYKF